MSSYFRRRRTPDLDHQVNSIESVVRLQSLTLAQQEKVAWMVSGKDPDVQQILAAGICHVLESAFVL